MVRCVRTNCAVWSVRTSDSGTPSDGQSTVAIRFCWISGPADGKSIEIASTSSAWPACTSATTLCTESCGRCEPKFTLILGYFCSKPATSFAKTSGSVVSRKFSCPSDSAAVHAAARPADAPPDEAEGAALPVPAGAAEVVAAAEPVEPEPVFDDPELEHALSANARVELADRMTLVLRRRRAG